MKCWTAEVTRTWKEGYNKDESFARVEVLNDLFLIVCEDSLNGRFVNSFQKLLLLRWGEQAQTGSMFSPSYQSRCLRKESQNYWKWLQLRPSVAKANWSVRGKPASSTVQRRGPTPLECWGRLRNCWRLRYPTVPSERIAAAGPPRPTRLRHWSLEFCVSHWGSLDSSSRDRRRRDCSVARSNNTDTDRGTGTLGMGRRSVRLGWWIPVRMQFV